MAAADFVAAVHVGVHKTGTSSLQGYLDKDPGLLTRNGFAYLSRTEMSEYVGWGKGLAAKRNAFPGRLAELGADPGLRGVFGSNENLVGRPFESARGPFYPTAADNLRALSQVLAPYRAMVFLSLRPQAEFLESYYLQTVHQGSSSTFEQWLAGIDLDGMSWHPLVAAARDCFGDDAVRIVDFRGIRAGQASYLASFLSELVPCSATDIDDEVPRNPSVSETGLRLALAANPHLRGADERRAMRKFLQRQFSNVDGPRPVLLAATTRSYLATRYDAEYEDIIASAPRPARPGAGTPAR